MRQQQSSRRDFLTWGAGLACSGLLVRSIGWTAQDWGDPILHADPSRSGGSGPTGTQSLGLGDERDGQLFVPTSANTGGAMAMALLLHGAGGAGARLLARLSPLAERHQLLLLAPDSRGPTWDAIRGRFGPDRAFIDRALAAVWSRYRVDPARIGIAGFSDGATYALSLGLANGGLFSRIVAFSPGFVIPTRHAGTPRVFISHGTSDRILNINRASRQIVPELRQAGYDVTYHEFAGDHTIPPDIAEEGLAMLAAPGPGTAR